MNFLSLVLFCGSLLAAAPEKSEAPADPVRQEYERLLELDERSLNEIHAIIDEAKEFEAKGAPPPQSTVALKIDQKIDAVRTAYDSFLEKNPKHADARLAYGSFLSEIGETEEAIVQWEKVREIAPERPSAWNNLANIYGHIGPVRKAIHYYEKAIELDPTEPVYLQNMATTVYLFRKDVMLMYRINEAEVFDKALALYRRARALDPENFLLASDYAQSYYGIKPLRTDDALAAWNYALKIADSEAEKQGVYLHLARIELNSGMFDEARKHLALVTLPDMQELKDRLQRNLEEKKAEAAKGGDAAKASVGE